MTNEEKLIAEIHKLSAENPESAKKLADWMDTTQGRPGTLVNSSTEDGFQNFISLFNELRGREVTSDNIHLAIQRIQSAGQGRFSQGKKPLGFVEVPRRVDPRQQPVDPNHKPGRFITEDVNEPHWKR